MPTPDKLRADAFTAFVRSVERRLQRALIARYGPELGREAAAEALAWAWEHWDRVQEIDNEAGYLYRVGTSRARRLRRSTRGLPADEQAGTPWIEPGLPAALDRLTANQRTAVVLVHCFAWTHAEVGELMGITTGTVRQPLQRGMATLRTELQVIVEA